MGWSLGLLVVVIGGIVAYTWNTMSKLRISNNYIKYCLNHIYPNKTFDSKDISIEEIVVSEFASDTPVKEKMIYHVQAADNDGTTYDLEARLFNPAAEFEEEEYKELAKNARPKEDDVNSAGGASSMSHMAGIESAQNMLRDQAKIEREDRLIEAKKKRMQQDVEVVGHLTKYTNLLPDVYFYDPKKLCLITEYTGNQSFKDTIKQYGSEEKLDVLKQVVTELAAIHCSFDEVQRLLPTRKPMDVEAYRQLLKAGLDQLSSAKAISSQHKSDLLNDYYLIAAWLSNNFINNIRFRSLSPYDIFVYNGRPLLKNWNDIDTGALFTNLVEFLKDPLLNINPAEEDELLEAYINSYAGESELAHLTKHYHLSSCHILIVQLGFMKLYIERLQEVEVQENANLLENWDQEHFDMLIDKALAIWQQYDESRAFANKVKEIYLTI